MMGEQTFWGPDVELGPDVYDSPSPCPECGALTAGDELEALGQCSACEDMMSKEPVRYARRVLARDRELEPARNLMSSPVGELVPLGAGWRIDELGQRWYSAAWAGDRP